MRNIEIKKIRIGSVFKLSFIIGAVFGLIIGIVFLATGSLAQSLGPQLGITFETGSSLQFGASLLGIVIGCLAYGLVNSIIGIIGAFIYNVLTAIVGGIVLKVEEK